VGLRCIGKGLEAPQLGTAALKAGSAEDPESDPRAPGGAITHRQRQIVEQKRAGRRPRGGPVPLEDDRREHLNPVAAARQKP
jgi:hypothetical protein